MEATSRVDAASEYTTGWVGLRGRVGAWMLASWPRRILERLFQGNPGEHFFETLALRGDETVVDVGCGSGYYALQVAARLDAGVVIGVDLSEEMLCSFRRRATSRRLTDRVELRKGGAHGLPVAEASADRVITTTVLHELPDADGVAREIARVLKPGGRVVVLDYRKPRPGEGGRGHRAEGGEQFDAAGLRGLLECAGLRDAHAEEFNVWVLGTAVKPG